MDGAACGPKIRVGMADDLRAICIALELFTSYSGLITGLKVMHFTLLYKRNLNGVISPVAVVLDKTLKKTIIQNYDDCESCDW